MRNSRFVTTFLLLSMSMAACGGEGARAKSLEGEPRFVLGGQTYFPIQAWLNEGLVFEMTMNSGLEGTNDGPRGFRQSLVVVASNNTGQVVDGPTVRVNELEFELADFHVGGSQQTAKEVGGKQNRLLVPLLYIEPDFSIISEDMSCELVAPVSLEEPGGIELIAEGASLYKLLTALFVCGDQ